MVILIKIKIEEILWIMKYFILASLEYSLFFILVKGINDINLISNPIHALNHEFVVKTIETPENIINKYKILLINLDIKKREFSFTEYESISLKFSLFS